MCSDDDDLSAVVVVVTIGHSHCHWCLSPFNTEYQFKLQADALEPCWQLTLAAVSMQSVTLVLPPD